MIVPTRPRAEQLRLLSSRTGEHVLDEYLEAAELGNRELSVLLLGLLSAQGDVRQDLLAFRRRPTAPTVLEFRIGTHFVDADDGWQAALSDMPASSEHSGLIGRDTADQHPQQAIAGLAAALSAKANAVDVAAENTVLQRQLDSKWVRWSGTQAEYDALPSKDNHTLYAIL